MSSSSSSSSVASSAYLGQQGYTIPKSVLGNEELFQIKKKLTMKPYTPGAPTQAVAFPCYKENENKLYVPRFFGEATFGEAKAKPPALLQGDAIDLVFPSALRPYQQGIVQKYLDHVLSHQGQGQGQGQAKPSGGGILEVPCGSGKTVMALYLVAQLKTKTLILVHKEFLMNQWIERIAEFLPLARVGKIQGAVYDVDHKDIVIGMIQSLYNDNRYHKDHFNSFGLTVIDETHRIGSEQFCQTLWKVPTRLMLGISATVDRKDGLTDILFHFIGPKLYSETKPIQDHPVVVHCHPLPAQLCSPEFLEVVHDRMGQVQITSMLSKVCGYEPRLQYAMHLLQQTLHQFPGNQVMVLAHQRALLTKVHDWIQEKQMGTVGYYVGGMKDAALKATESKQIVLATYAMAAEALDIKSLSSLLLLTPKVDVVQSVGRILRERHDHPVVLDLVDPHRCFQNQFKKRLAYYRSCKYQIVMHKKDTGFQEEGEEEDQEDQEEEQEEPPAKRVSMFRLTGNKTTTL